jgi:biopolymer transport protein ExbD
MRKDFCTRNVVLCLLFIFIIAMNFKKYKIDKNQEVSIEDHIVYS